MSFIHYTRNVESVIGILNNGLLLNPLKRNLIHLFSDSDIFKDREPQQFGLSSVRNEGFFGSKRHCSAFGEFGIVFTDEWIKSKNFRQVVYLKYKSILFYKSRFQVISAIQLCSE